MGKMRSAEKVCVGEKNNQRGGRRLVFSKKNTREKNLKPVGGGAAGPFLLVGRKSWVLGFFVFFVESVKIDPPFCVS